MCGVLVLVLVCYFLCLDFLFYLCYFRVKTNSRAYFYPRPFRFRFVCYVLRRCCNIFTSCCSYLHERFVDFSQQLRFGFKHTHLLYLLLVEHTERNISSIFLLTSLFLSLHMLF